MRPGYDTFLNVFSHILNLARYMLGASPTLLECKIAAPDAATFSLDFAGVTCAFELANEIAGSWREGLTINFERGSLTIELPAPFSEEEARVILDSDGKPLHLPRGRSWSFRRQAAAFVSDILRRSQPLASGDDSVTDVALAEAIWKRHVNG
jgi:predicted dehydrogenase